MQNYKKNVFFVYFFMSKTFRGITYNTRKPPLAFARGGNPNYKYFNFRMTQVAGFRFFA